MLVIVIPVFILTFTIAWKYREGNKKADYTPNWDQNGWLEALWWGLPCAIILALAIITWTSSHQLDPFKPISNGVKPITIQVVALDWKWLFIYPEQHIATVNYLKIPVNTPVNFQVTSDAPMNSFWIPQLGGQIYAMPGMITQLHLIAETAGEYQGLSANISGDGFAGMHFNTSAVTENDFIQWVGSTESGQSVLNQAEYNRLTQPSSNMAPSSYGWEDSSLFATIITKFTGPENNMPNMNMPDMNMHN